MGRRDKAAGPRGTAAGCDAEPLAAPWVGRGAVPMSWPHGHGFAPHVLNRPLPAALLEVPGKQNPPCGSAPVLSPQAICFVQPRLCISLRCFETQSVFQKHCLCTPTSDVCPASHLLVLTVPVLLPDGDKVSPAGAARQSNLSHRFWATLIAGKVLWLPLG